MNYDIVVVGSGLSGAVISNRLAEVGAKILVVEKRTEIGGNVFDKKIKKIIVHKYGPHIFHTNNDKVFNYMSNFWELNSFSSQFMTIVKNETIPIPFNFGGIDKFFPKKKKFLKNLLIKEYGLNSRVPIFDLMNNKHKELKKLSLFIFENVFKPYVLKMWGISPQKLDLGVMRRVPINISYSKKYFNNKYEGIPKQGYTNTIKKMLEHKNITVLSNTNSRDLLNFSNDTIYYGNKKYEGYVVYSGPLDELFNFKYGELPYRSLNIEFNVHDYEFFQKCAIVNHPFHPTITRIIEHKYFYNVKFRHTVVSIEKPGAYDRFSKKFNIPFYPINSKKNNALLNKYIKLASKYSHFYSIGRMATYKYIDMDTTIQYALDLSDQLIIKWKNT